MAIATQPVEQILAQFQTQVLKAKLLELPSQIEAVKKELRQAREELKYAEEDRLQAEMILTAAITAEIDPGTTKAKYSNDTARKAELVNRKYQDEHYKACEEAVREAQVKVDNLQFKLERLQDEYKSYRYVTDLTSREISLYASDGVNGNGNGRQDETEGVKAAQYRTAAAQPF